MELCCNHFPFVFSLVIISVHSFGFDFFNSKIKRIREIEGSVTDLEFDYDCNVYGVEHVPQFKNFSMRLYFPFFRTCHRWSNVFFKLDANQRVVWKIQFSDTITTECFSNRPAFERTKILINRQNDVYLIVEKEEVTEIYTAAIPVLKKISEYQTQPSIKQAFIMEDNIIIVGFPDENLSTIKVLKVKSGKWLTIASTKEDSFHAVKDTEGNINFTSMQELSVLPKESLKEDNPQLKIIPDVANSKHSNEIVVTNLTISDENELYVQLAARKAVRATVPRNSTQQFFTNFYYWVEVKKMKNNTLKTVLSQPSRSPALLKTVKKGAIVRLDTDTGLELVYVNENGTTVPLSHADFSLEENFKALSDKDGNLFFESHGKEDWQKTPLTFRNRTTREIVQIGFEPELSSAFFKFHEEMLFDEEENIWIAAKSEGFFQRIGLFQFDEGPRMLIGDLYYLKKGTFTAKKILHKNVQTIRKSRNDDIFIVGDSGLFVSLSSKSKRNCKRYQEDAGVMGFVNSALRFLKWN